MAKDDISHTSTIESQSFHELLLLCEDQQLAQVQLNKRHTQIFDDHRSTCSAALDAEPRDEWNDQRMSP